MQDHNNDEPPITQTHDSGEGSRPSTARSKARRGRSPFLGCVAERLVTARYRAADAQQRQWGRRPFYRVQGADPRVSLAAVTAQLFHDNPDQASAVIAAKMALGMFSMTKKERSSLDFLERKKEFLFYVRTIHELMPEIEASAAEMWVTVLQDGGSQ